jgi:hypothetical protein
MESNKLSRRPRYGLHNGIKYSPKQTGINYCLWDDKLFLQNGKGKKQYCSVKCREKARKQQNKKNHQKMLQKRDKQEHANNMREQRRKHKNNSSMGLIGKKPAQTSHDNSSQFDFENPGITTVPQVPTKKTKNGIEKDYDAFHKKLQKEKRVLKK